MLWRGHAGKLFSDGRYAAHNDRNHENGIWTDFFDKVWDELYVFYVPPVINNCHGPKDFWSADSTVGGEPDDQFTVKHMWVCCWKEKMPGEAPWRSRTTPYACLNWDENRGTTWDTLISPRANMAGCSSVVFKQWSISTLQHGANKVIEIRGSTDDGATWPYLIGTDTTTQASLTWATNQRNVRIAWIYKGPVEVAEII